MTACDRQLSPFPLDEQLSILFPACQSKARASVGLPLRLRLPNVFGCRKPAITVGLKEASAMATNHVNRVWKVRHSLTKKASLRSMSTLLLLLKIV
jgi:hypothetical protein